MLNPNAAIVIAGMALMLLTAAARHTAALYRAEPVSKVPR